MKDLLEQIRDRVLRHESGVHANTGLPQAVLAVVRRNSVPQSIMCGAGICLVLQGTKQLFIGEKMLRHQAGHSFASLIELPSTRCVFEMENHKPYVATGLSIDHNALVRLMADLPPAHDRESTPCFSEALADRELLEAWDRYLALLDTPADIPALAPPRERELLYRLLQSPHGALLKQLAQDEGKLVQVKRAIDWIRGHFDEPLSINALAEISEMSVPSLNRHFRAATAASPLQYQKTLRLRAARQLLAKNNNVTHAASAVGYESTSQFSREYSRLFGHSPKQDAQALRSNSHEVTYAVV
jgi:AraC-like DNA-binding protein